MEERDSLSPPPPPPAAPPHIDPPIDNKPHLPYISPGTFIVQVPKDQIYRVPPLENARIAELHRNPPRDRKQKGRRCCLVIIATIVFIGTILGCLFSMVVAPKSPRFSIQHFGLETSTPHSQYNVILQAYNPNSKIGILYKEGGSVSLSLRQQQIASGNYPSFYQPTQNSTVFGLALRGSEARLPKEVNESATNDKKKVHVTFSVAIKVQVRNRMGLLRSGSMKYDVKCQITVDTLSRNTQVVSQQCLTKRH